MVGMLVVATAIAALLGLMRTMATDVDDPQGTVFYRVLGFAYLFSVLSSISAGMAIFIRRIRGKLWISFGLFTILSAGAYFSLFK